MTEKMREAIAQEIKDMKLYGVHDTVTTYRGKQYRIVEETEFTGDGFTATGIFSIWNHDDNKLYDDEKVGEIKA